MFVAIAFVGASCSFSSAAIDEITITDKVDETTQEAIGSKTTLFSDAGTIYASAKVKNAPPDTVVKGLWYLNDDLLGEKEVTVEGTRWIGFRITKALFTAGEYRFRAEISGADRSQETTFTVQASEADAQELTPTTLPETDENANIQTPTDQSELPATDSQY